MGTWDAPGSERVNSILRGLGSQQEAGIKLTTLKSSPIHDSAAMVRTAALAWAWDFIHGAPNGKHSVTYYRTYLVLFGAQAIYILFRPQSKALFMYLEPLGVVRFSLVPSSGAACTVCALGTVITAPKYEVCGVSVLGAFIMVPKYGVSRVSVLVTVMWVRGMPFIYGDLDSQGTTDTGFHKVVLRWSYSRLSSVMSARAYS